MKVNSADNEQFLLQQLIEGNEQSFNKIYELHSREIFRFVIKFVNSVPLAEDLTQEIFIKIWENRHRLENVQSFKAYLFVTARNHTFNRLKEVFKSDVAITEVVKGFIQLRNVTEDDIIDKEYLLFLKRTLNSLPERTKEIFKQCREYGRTYDEVAATLNISRNAVKNHMVHAMKVFRSSVEKELDILVSLLLFVIFKR
ncbi:MAG: RNA polymerase sigma-70 factor [Mucilaginibacter sp.]|uniref:RNA polymerase sigma factor n=1 Tax=Mucilaginibacter sp. TaxID=1882438 RepID=UPI0031A5F666